MSKDSVVATAAELAILWQKAKLAALAGAGYLFARKPALAARVYSGLLYVITRQAILDTKMAGGVIWRELAKPVLAEDAALLKGAANAHWAEVVARGPIWGTTLILTVGGGIAQSIDDAVEYLGLDTPTNPSGPGEIAH
jgi:hypothetical protein